MDEFVIDSEPTQNEPEFGDQTFCEETGEAGNQTSNPAVHGH